MVKVGFKRRRKMIGLEKFNPRNLDENACALECCN